jgi:hypothetical protein
MRSIPVLLAITLAACHGSAVSPSAATSTAAATPVAVPPAPAVFPVGTHARCGEHDGDDGCGEMMARGAPDACAGASQPIAFPETTAATDASGKPVTRAGAKLTGVPVVAVTDLLAHPDSFAGKTVRLEGNVSAMCQHRRAWFAVQGEGRPGATVQVIAAPAFLVPGNAVGMRARTEGQVEVVATTAGPQAKALVVRATGAEFL